MGAAGRVLHYEASADVVVKVGGAVLYVAAELVSERLAVGQADDSGGGASVVFQDFAILDMGDGVQVVGDVVIDVVGGALHCVFLSLRGPGAWCPGLWRLLLVLAHARVVVLVHYPHPLVAVAALATVAGVVAPALRVLSAVRPVTGVAALAHGVGQLGRGGGLPVLYLREAVGAQTGSVLGDDLLAGEACAAGDGGGVAASVAASVLVHQAAVAALQKAVLVGVVAAGCGGVLHGVGLSVWCFAVNYIVACLCYIKQHGGNNLPLA